jgi:hypothetical protein
MLNGRQLSHDDASDHSDRIAEEPLITPLDSHASWQECTLFDERPRRVTLRRGIIVTGLAVLILFAVTLSATGTWQQIANPVNVARQWLQPPSVVVQSPIPWAQVRVDGHDAGGPGLRIPLSLGTHTITVRAIGFAPYTRQLSFGDTLRSMHGGLTIAVPAHILPGAAEQMYAAIDRAFDTAYGGNSITTIAPGELYAPGHVAHVPLRARLTVAMVTGGSPYLTFLSPLLNIVPQRAVASVDTQLEVQFFAAATGRLVYTAAFGTPEHQDELIELWPSAHGWQASPLVGYDLLRELQSAAGQAQISALLPPSARKGLEAMSLNPVSEGTLFTTYLPGPMTPTWLFHLGMLYTVGTFARQLTPELPPVPAQLMPLVRRGCAYCIAQSGALIPTSGLLYLATAPGRCSPGDGIWLQSAQASESCRNDQLILSDPDCPCPLAIAELQAIGSVFPHDYVVEVTMQAAADIHPTAMFGIKFREQATWHGRPNWGGYAYLINTDGRWQFTFYDRDGTRHVLAVGQWAGGQIGITTMDVAVHGSRFSLYLNGMFITTQYHAAYGGGTLALVVGPGGTVAFSNLGIYTLP